MKRTLLLASLLTGSILVNGCTGNEVVPNNATQTGAVTGAVAGAVVGYNTKGHHKGERAALGALAGAALGGLVGDAVDENNPQPVETGGWHE